VFTPSLPGRSRRRAVAALLVALLAAPAAHAGDDDDHDRARAAVQAGEVLPLAALLERVQRSHPGRVLEVELEREDGRWVYELKILQADGRLLKLEVDAATARVLKLRRDDDKRERRRAGDSRADKRGDKNDDDKRDSRK